MVAEISASKAKGSVIAPPSKSIAHRMLICAALASGTSKIYNIARSEDILATIDCLSALGAEFRFENDFVLVKGINFENIKNPICANCRESGSTLRFMVPIMLLIGAECTLTGSDYLFTRPLTIYEEICKKFGFVFDKQASSLTIKGRLKCGKYEIPGNISSQFISGLLFALPMLKNDSKIIITGDFESRSYIDLTIRALNQFGIKVDFTENELYIYGNQVYKPAEIAVEGDYSNSAFFDALNCLGSKIEIQGLNTDSYQGDKVYNKYFNAIKNGMPTLDITDCPDLAPILFTLAAFYNGAVFTGTRRLKMKESDRAAVMQKELSHFGANIEVYENSVVVNKSKLHKPQVVLNGHNDHRIVMSLSVLLSVFGGKISGAEAVSKSFPDFFDKISSLGIGVTLNAD